MDFLLHLLTNDDIPRELGRRVWLLEQEFNAILAGRAFRSPRQAYGVWVEAYPPRPHWAKSLESKAEVKLDRRDGAVRSAVIGDFDRYRAASSPEGVDLYVRDCERALRQIPPKFLLSDELPALIEALFDARKAYHQKHTGFVPELDEPRAPAEPLALETGDDETPEPIQIVAQWLEAQFRAIENSRSNNLAVDPLSAIENALEERSNGLYYVDGHDSGSGTVNIFLYADVEEPALARLIALAEEGVLPSGVRIGVPEGGRVRAAYPPGLREFDLIDAAQYR